MLRWLLDGEMREPGAIDAAGESSGAARNQFGSVVFGAGSDVLPPTTEELSQAQQRDGAAEYGADKLFPAQTLAATAHPDSISQKGNRGDC
jgi:hypothetical protein